MMDTQIDTTITIRVGEQTLTLPLDELKRLRDEIDRVLPKPAPAPVPDRPPGGSADGRRPDPAGPVGRPQFVPPKDRFAWVNGVEYTVPERRR